VIKVSQPFIQRTLGNQWPGVDSSRAYTMKGRIFGKPQERKSDNSLSDGYIRTRQDGWRVRTEGGSRKLSSLRELLTVVAENQQGNLNEGWAAAAKCYELQHRQGLRIKDGNICQEVEPRSSISNRKVNGQVEQSSKRRRTSGVPQPGGFFGSYRLRILGRNEKSGRFPVGVCRRQCAESNRTEQSEGPETGKPVGRSTF